MEPAEVVGLLWTDGIEWTVTDDGCGEEGSCARCGSSVEWLDCWNCAGDGFSYHDCGEDCCACLHPEDNVECDFCDGKGGRWHCTNSPEWCASHPMTGREHVESTALKPEAWSD